MDRYNHDLAGDDTDDTDDTPVFGSFNSYTPQYRKQHYSWSRHATASTTDSSKTTPTTLPSRAQENATATATMAGTGAMPKQMSTAASQEGVVNKFLNTLQLRKLDVSNSKGIFASRSIDIYIFLSFTCSSHPVV